MIRRCVIDTNWLGNAALAEYLAGSTKNRAVIAEMTMVEVHKQHASRLGRELLQILCQFPRQVIILKGTRDLCRDSGLARGLVNRMIEPVQTASFGEYCRTVINVKDDRADAHFSLMERQSREQVDGLQANIANILTLFERCLPIFERSELDRLRKRIPYTADLQRKLIHLSFDMHKMLLRSLSIEEQFHPRDQGRAIDTFVFRYALAVVIFLTRWIRQGEAKEIKEAKLVNHVFDLKTAAIATFFDGLKTEDEMPRDVHREIKFILGAVGGYVNCGNGSLR